MRTKATNAHQALPIIGLRAGANLVTGLILRRAFPTVTGSLIRRFWDQSGRASALALTVARGLAGIDLDAAHIYALFRDCGMPVMIGKFADYARSFDDPERMPGASVVAAEETRYHYSHARVGYALARRWLLPAPVCCAILYHHDFEKVASGGRDVEPADRRLVALGLLIEQIAAICAGAGMCPDWASDEQSVLRTSELTPEQIITLALEAGHDAG